MNIEKLKRARKGKIDSMRSMLDTVESREDKNMSEEERTVYDALENEVGQLDASIAREVRLQALEARTAASTAEAVPPSEYRAFGEFICDVIQRTEKRTTTMGQPEQAGLLVPTEFVPGLRQIDVPELTLVRDRATKVPASQSSPDATTYMPVLNQFDGKGVYGGVVMQWTAETGTRANAGDINVHQIGFTPYLITGYIDISNQLMDNYEGIGNYVQQRMSLAIAGAENKVFLRGTGVGQPTGFVGHPCNATVTRGTVGQITYADITNMLSLALSSGSYVFIVSRTAMAKLMTLKDTAGNLIWQPNARDKNPGLLFGYPVYFSDQCPALGAQGDITLCDLTHYGIKDGSPLRMFADPYTQAERGVTRLYVSLNVDAKPLILGTVKGEDGTERSAFVTLG